MNKRLKKKSERMRRKVLHRILDLALDINGMQASKKKLTGDHPTAFFDMSGHVAGITVSIHNNGWEADQNSDQRFECYFDHIPHTDTPMRMLAKLERYKEESGI